MKNIVVDERQRDVDDLLFCPCFAFSSLPCVHVYFALPLVLLSSLSSLLCSPPHKK